MTVIDWLLDSDPSIRWQVMRDLTHEQADVMLERRLFRRKTTGEVIDPSWLRFSFPTWYFYDVLRGLEHLRGAEVTPDERVDEAIGVVEGNRDPDGRWPLQNVHAGESHFEMEDGEGKASRWNTLRAMRVLDWFAQGGSNRQLCSGPAVQGMPSNDSETVLDG